MPSISIHMVQLLHFSMLPYSQFEMMVGSYALLVQMQEYGRRMAIPKRHTLCTEESQSRACIRMKVAFGSFYIRLLRLLHDTVSQLNHSCPSPSTSTLECSSRFTSHQQT